MRLFLSPKPSEDAGIALPVFIRAEIGMTDYVVLMLLGVSALTAEGRCKSMLSRFPELDVFRKHCEMVHIFCSFKE